MDLGMIGLCAAIEQDMKMRVERSRSRVIESSLLESQSLGADSSMTNV
jgi:hypothetical protein